MESNYTVLVNYVRVVNDQQRCLKTNITTFSIC